MADLRSVFVNLEDSSTKEGLPLHKALEGEAIASKNAQGALVAKDSSGNFKYIEIDDAGNVKSSVVEDSAPLSAHGTHAGSGSFVTVATITLAVGKVYRGLDWLVSCFRDAIFQIDQVDDTTTTTVLESIRVGNAMPSNSGALANFKITAGASGTQSLILKAKNLNATSDVDGFIGVRQMV